MRREVWVLGRHGLEGVVWYRVLAVQAFTLQSVGVHREQSRLVATEFKGQPHGGNIQMELLW